MKEFFIKMRNVARSSRPPESDAPPGTETKTDERYLMTGGVSNRVYDFSRLPRYDDQTVLFSETQPA